MGRKLGGNNLSDSCYVELLLRGMEHSEKGEMIKAQVLRHATAPYEEGTRVMVTADNKAYRAKIIRLRNLGGMLSTVDVEYDPNDAFDDNGFLIFLNKNSVSFNSAAPSGRRSRTDCVTPPPASSCRQHAWMASRFHLWSPAHVRPNIWPCLSPSRN